MSISAGDTATVSVTAHSSTSGAATIKNLSNGQLQQVELSSDYALCRQNAEWIVEIQRINTGTYFLLPTLAG